MKSILSAAALLAVLASPVLAEEAAQPQTQPTAQSAVVIVPATTDATVSEALPAAGAETPSNAAMNGHGCGSKQQVYLTN